MTPKSASSEARKHLRLLAGELRVDLLGLEDDDLEMVALRFVLDGRITTAALQAIVDDVRGGTAQATVHATGLPGNPSAPNVRGGDGGGQATVVPQHTQEPAPPLPSAPSRGMHYLATEATNARYRQRLALAHRNEDARTALYIVPRRPEVLPVGKPHPSCIAAFREGLEASICSRPACQWLLGKDDPYIDHWLDRDDDLGGRL